MNYDHELQIDMWYDALNDTYNHAMPPRYYYMYIDAISEEEYS